MRAVTLKIATAFVAGRKASDGATRTDGQTLWLHGNAIARKVATFPSGSPKARLEISWAGWVTSTTAERINGVLSVAGSSFRVGRFKFAPVVYCKGVRTDMPSNSWQAVTDV